jgi:hypothetical protein
MSSLYASLALSYRDWHHRVTPRGMEHMDPAMGLSALHAANVFSLLMLAPSSVIPSWLFVALPIACAVTFAWGLGKIYRSSPAPTNYARLSDQVPGLREFPLVYGYLFATLLLFVGCLYVAVQGAA